MLLKNAFIALFSFSILHAETLKECKTEEDRISGCVKRDYHSNGKLWEEIPYKNNKREGMSKWYYENGSLKAETPFNNNGVNGDMKLYTEDKKLLALIKAENHKFISGKCFNDKVLTDKELKEMRRDGFIERAIIYLKEICLKSDSK